MEEGMHCSIRGAVRRRGTFGAAAPAGELMSVVAGCIAALPVSAFPAAVELRWETQNRTVCNELEHTSEERELVYEISWIAELGLWRRFLRSNRKLQS